MTSRQLASIAISKGATQKITELSPLISLLKKRKISTVVEIGTEKGGTFYIWCRIAQPDAVIVSIDLPGGLFGGGYTLRDVKKFRRYKKKKQKLHFIRKDSHRQDSKKELMKKLNSRKIDFLMIDGDHRYAGVRRDWRMYSPLVKQNGLIAFHDILFHSKIRECKVDRLWNEIKDDYRHMKFTDKKDDRGWGQWGGIGIIFYNVH